MVIAAPSPRSVNRLVVRSLTTELPDELRGLRVEVLRETLSSGTPVSPLGLTVVLSVLDEVCEAPLVVTCAALEELVWFGLSRFCCENELPVPDDWGASLTAALAVATRLGVFADGADSVPSLFETVRRLGVG